jgi:hypothetical protein
MKRIISIFVLFSYLQAQVIYANENGLLAENQEELPQIAPVNLIPRVSSEYFSTNPSVKLLMPISIWGEVTQPGIHYVPLGYSVAQGISLAGGPTTFAGLPNIKFIRGADSEELNIYGNARDKLLQKNDTIIVNGSIKKDLPLVFGGISVGVSLLTLLVVIFRK